MSQNKLYLLVTMRNEYELELAYKFTVSFAVYGCKKFQE